MRFLKILGISIAVLIIAFLIVGIAVPTFEYGSSITVNSPRQHAWDVFHNTTQTKSWNAGFASLKLREGEFFQPGSSYELIMVDGSERMIMTENITSISPPYQISYLLNNDVLQSEFQYTFEALGDSTRIESRYKITGNNLIWKSVLFLSKSYLNSASEEQLRAFKKYIEQ